MMKQVISLLLLLASLAAAQEAQTLNAALEAATVGSVMLLPEAKPEGWTAYLVAMGERTPGHKEWGTSGRVALAYRGNESRRVLVIKIQGDDLWFWVAGKLEGKGWSISDRLPQPAPVVAVVPARSESFDTLVAKAKVEEVIELPSTKPAGWVEVKLTQTSASFWRSGVVGCLICEADGTRLPFVIVAVGDGDQATAWFQQADAIKLAGRQWREVRRASVLAASPRPTPPLAKPADEVGAPAKSIPVTSPQNTAKSPVSAPAPPSAQVGSAQPADNWLGWVTDPEVPAKLPLGSKVSVMGIDPHSQPAGWRYLAVVDPPAAWQPGAVVETSEGRAIVVSRQESDGPRTRTIAGYWYRPGAPRSTALPTIDQAGSLAVGARVTLPEGADWAKPPAGWVRLDYGPLTNAQRQRLPVGTVVELIGGGKSIRAVVIATVYDQAKPEIWRVRLWAAAEPEGKVEWGLRLP